MHFLQKCYQNLVRNVRHCNKFAKIAILVQTCKILARNANLTRISEEFCKICDSCNLGRSKIAKVAIKSQQYTIITSITIIRQHPLSARKLGHHRHRFVNYKSAKTFTKNSNNCNQAELYFDIRCRDESSRLFWAIRAPQN